MKSKLKPIILTIDVWPTHGNLFLFDDNNNHLKLRMQHSIEDSFFINKFHPIQGLRVTQGRSLQSK